VKIQQSDEANLITTLYRSIFPRSERGVTDQDDYFTPRLAEADRQLRALAKRIKGSYSSGAVTWPAFSKRQPAQRGAESAADAPIDSLWSGGSRVDKTMHGLDIQVTFGVERLSTGAHGPATPPDWLVLAPGITVTASPRSAQPLIARPDASWSADEETATGAARLRLLRNRGTSAELALQAMPPALTSARSRLIEKAARITCSGDTLFVIPRPLPRTPADPPGLGQASFDLDTLTDLIDRTRAFAHALAAK
jgi:hypothetical protein